MEILEGKVKQHTIILKYITGVVDLVAFHH